MHCGREEAREALKGLQGDEERERGEREKRPCVDIHGVPKLSLCR